MPEKRYYEGMHGIGDNINQRAFIRALVARGHEIWLKTPLPEIYAGIPRLHFVRSATRLRTQQKHEARSRVRFESIPHGIVRRRIFYGNDHLRHGSVFDAMEQQFGVAPLSMDLPHYELPIIGIPAGKPVALIRPTTERTEWHNASRGPLNQYVDQVACMLAHRGWHVISVADTEQGKEWITDKEPMAHQKFHHGELSITEMLALVERADLVVTGACVIFHAAIAYQRPMVCLQGGNGGNNHHSRITDKRCCDLSQTLFIYPDEYCHCQQMQHQCIKTISDLDTRILPFISQVSARFKTEGV